MIPSLTPPLPYDVVATRNDSPSNVEKYSTFDHISGTTWLAFRDLSFLFNQHVNGTIGIDYGCGAGRSTRFLASLDMNPVGLDVSQEMLVKANEINQQKELAIRYQQIKSGEIPLADSTCDFVFSSFVFLVIPNKEEMRKILKDMHRVLKPDGTVIIATGSEKMHDPNRNWVSYKTDFPENINPMSGDLLKIAINEVGAEFYDYNWLDNDYQEVFVDSGFQVTEKLTPLGNSNDGRKWKDEILHSPYYIYTLKKKELEVRD